MDVRSLQGVLHFYGENDSLPRSKLENFLHLITSRRPLSIDNAGNPLGNVECMSMPELLSEFGLGNVSQVSAGQLELMCPAILTQVLIPSCPANTQTNTQPINHEVWGYGFLAVTIINLAALLGLFLIPFTKKSYFPKVLTYFVGLAIGTLFSNAVLQLIPEALGFDPKADNYVEKAVGIFGGFYLLFFAEKILKMALKVESEVRHGHGHSHFPPMEAADVTVTSFSNEIVINSISNNITANSNNDITSDFTNNPNEKSSLPNNSPDHGQEVNFSLSCRWLRGERVSNIKTMAWMITLSDALHNFVDGLAIGASFTLSLLTGFSTSIAILCEEFPHELGDFVILLTSGMSVPQVVCFNMLSACCCYLGLMLGILLGSSFAPNAIFAIAGGMFLYIALADMFPELNNIMSGSARGTKDKVIFFLVQNGGILSGFCIILLITLFAGDINLG
ncbi:zinc transporter ZIP8 [Chanos chanos]|uniref:Zinc transporter ZIP8 n=1 Tax=Chanos chanos TaxID=29144 RepID=A0A6J2V9F0_CHACN|nr:zinc transporter ZIP8 [Chanos chanos]